VSSKDKSEAQAARGKDLDLHVYDHFPAKTSSKLSETPHSSEPDNDQTATRRSKLSRWQPERKPNPDLSEEEGKPKQAEGKLNQADFGREAGLPGDGYGFPFKHQQLVPAQPWGVSQQEYMRSMCWPVPQTLPYHLPQPHGYIQFGDQHYGNFAYNAAYEADRGMWVQPVQPVQPAPFNYGVYPAGPWAYDNKLKSQQFECPPYELIRQQPVQPVIQQVCNSVADPDSRKVIAFTLSDCSSENNDHDLEPEECTPAQCMVQDARDTKTVGEQAVPMQPGHGAFVVNNPLPPPRSSSVESDSSARLRSCGSQVGHEVPLQSIACPTDNVSTADETQRIQPSRHSWEQHVDYKVEQDARRPSGFSVDSIELLEEQEEERRRMKDATSRSAEMCHSNEMEANSDVLDFMSVDSLEERIPTAPPPSAESTSSSMPCSSSFSSVHNPAGLVNPTSTSAHNQPCAQENASTRSQAEGTTSYTCCEEIGRGSSAVVMRAEHGEDTVALKVFNISKDGPNEMTYRMLSAVSTEAFILKNIDHPYILKYRSSLGEGRHRYMATELCSGGNLQDDLSRRGKYPESFARILFQQILSALEVLHDSRVVHHDLKLENVLLKESGEVRSIRLVDLGSAHISDLHSPQSCLVGTHEYMPPELIVHRERDDSTLRVPIKPTASMDMWSAGVVLYMLLGGYNPFLATSTKRVFHSIVTVSFDFKQPVWETVSDTAKDLISKLLVRDPEQRLSAREALQHAWFASSLEPIQLPQQRSLARQILKHRFMRAVWAIVAVRVLRKRVFLKKVMARVCNDMGGSMYDNVAAEPSGRRLSLLSLGKVVGGQGDEQQADDFACMVEEATEESEADEYVRMVAKTQQRVKAWLEDATPATDEAEQGMPQALDRHSA